VSIYSDSPGSDSPYGGGDSPYGGGNGGYNIDPGTVEKYTNKGQKAVKVAGKVKNAVDSVGDFLGIGEKTKAVPKGFPVSSPSGPVAGEVFQGGTGDNTPYNKSSLTLRPGFHDYGDLSGAGVHDKISGIKIKDGFEAVFFKGVQDGGPAGDSMKITGPKAIPELRDYKPGFENSISSIAVRKIPEQGSGGGSVDPGTGTGDGSGGSGGGSGGSGGSGGGSRGGSGTGGGSTSPPGIGDIPGVTDPGTSESSGSSVIVLAAAAGVLLYIANMG